jgi:hypothetical protein
MLFVPDDSLNSGGAAQDTISRPFTSDLLRPRTGIERRYNVRREELTVTLKGYTYRSTVAVYGGEFFLPFAAVHRDAAGVTAGQPVRVTVVLDTSPREVEVPKDLAAALKKAGVRAAFDALAFTHRKEHVRAIEEARAPETRARRIDTAVAMVMRGYSRVESRR